MNLAVWIRNGRVLLSQLGRVLLCNRCPCEPVDFFLGCEHCPDGMACCWEFALAGVVNNACSACPNLNRTYILQGGPCDFLGDPCTFNEAESAICPMAGGGTVDIILTFVAAPATTWTGRSDVWALSFADATAPPGTQPYATYELPKADFDCKGRNVLPLTSHDSACAGWPDNIALDPINCPAL